LLASCRKLALIKSLMQHDSLLLLHQLITSQSVKLAASLYMLHDLVEALKIVSSAAECYMNSSCRKEQECTMQLSVQWATTMSQICLTWWGLTPTPGSSYTVITTEAMTDLLARLF